MKSFKGYLLEQIKKGFHSFFHPTRGMYKLSHDTERNVYHVHNKFGDLTHSFSGHLTPDEVAKELKSKEGMILIDKLHEDRLDELAKKPPMSDEDKAKQVGAKKASNALNFIQSPDAIGSNAGQHNQEIELLLGFLSFFGGWFLNGC
jgi:hypothetical protein